MHMLRTLQLVNNLLNHLMFKIFVGRAKQAKLDHSGAYMYSAQSCTSLLGGLEACPQENLEN